MSHDAHAHAENNDSIWKIALNMMIACLLSGAVIAGVYSITEPYAVKERENTKQKAMRSLIDGVQEFKEISGKKDWYAAVKDGKMIAYIVPAENKGYEGTIKMVAAIGTDGKILNFKIVDHHETPGLGDKADTPKFIGQYKGKAVADLVVVKEPTEKNIQALTGATITSRAVTNGIKKAAEEVLAYEKTQKK